jgi:hypothetical protein
MGDFPHENHFGNSRSHLSSRQIRCGRTRIPFREFVTEAVKDKLVADAKAAEQPWMAAFGKLRHLRKETAKINHLIEVEFAQIEAEDRQ